MKNNFLFLVFIVLIFSGCVTATPGSVNANSTSELPNIQETYRDRFSQTERGMPLATFQQLWPEALKSGETEEYSIYEFSDSTLYYNDADYSIAFWFTGAIRYRTYLQRATFFFADGALVKFETDAKIIED